MPIRHTERSPDDPGQAGNVRHLIEDALIHLIEQGRRRVDAGRDQHAWLGGGRNLPYALADRHCPACKRTRGLHAFTGWTASLVQMSITTRAHQPFSLRSSAN